MSDAAAEKPARRDWVQEAYQAFIANADGLDPTDPVKAVGAYFEKTASEELKARAKAEGRTPAKCWRFVEAVARKALNGRSGHVDPSVVYAIAMHWYEDVPVDWDKKSPEPLPPAPQPAPQPAQNPSEAAPPAPQPAPQPAQNPSEAAPEPKKEAPKAEKPKRRPKDRQTFFFDILAGDSGASVG